MSRLMFTNIRAGVPTLLACALALSACGGSSDQSSTATASAAPSSSSSSTAVAPGSSGTSTPTAAPPAPVTTPVGSPVTPVSPPVTTPVIPPVTPPAASGTLVLSAANYGIAQNAGGVTVTVNRSGAVSAAVSVQYTTSDGTAAAGTVYKAAKGTLQWAANDAAAKTVTIPIVDLTPMSSSENFKFTLSAPTGGATLGSPAVSVVTVSPPPPVSGLAIKVSGNHFVDENGTPVQLRGVNVSGLEFVAIGGWDPGNPWGSQTGDATPNWSTIKSWGTNSVRLPLNEASWLGLSCLDVGGNAGRAGATVKADPGGNYQSTVKKSVADATAAGLYVILDLHWAAPNDGAAATCPTTQNPMADADHAMAFWTSVATQFKSNPAVLFELFNEPFLDAAALVGNTPWADLLNGGSVTQFAYAGGSGVMNLTWATAGMQQMLDAVRATGATNVVLTSTLQWSQQMDGWLKYKPADPAGQLAAVWHAYASSQYPTQVACVADGILGVSLPQCSAQEMAAVSSIMAAGYPVVATEFGDSIGGSAPWASVLLPFADTHGVSYLAWAWDAWAGDSANVLITDAAGDPTPGYGAYVKKHYQCRAAGTANCP